MEESKIKELEKLLEKSKGFAGMKRIMDSTEGVSYIASGSARAVYRVSDDKVIKIAKNTKGIAQNEAEADWALKNYGVASDWYDVSDKFYWIESELCKKCSLKLFKEITGLDFKYFSACLEYNHYERNGSRYYKPPKPEGYEDSWDNEFLDGFYQYIGDFGVPVGDLTRISSYGINHKGEVVLVDTGLNGNVLETYYQRKREAEERVNEFFKKIKFI